MFAWIVELCPEGAKWYWICRNPGGTEVCRSKQLFDTESDAGTGFEREFEDHWSCIQCRFAK